MVVYWCTLTIPPGSEWPFGPDELRRLYITVGNYRQHAGEALRDQIDAGFLLPCDAEVLRRETVEQVDF